MMKPTLLKRRVSHQQLVLKRTPITVAHPWNNMDVMSATVMEALAALI
jgi:hypothetical protein